YLSDGGNISGSFSVELVISNADPADAGEYDCEITGECNTEISESATLTILGINTILNGNIKIFPNPTTGLLTILNEGNHSINMIIITSQIGFTIFTCSDIKREQKIDLSGFGKGIYLIEVQIEESIINSKIILY
ncbi:MAG: T9SS type A sorting domain-containing protein, partial [Bacteroidetes bacterium]|nr:T9SS type A sorting domain-containing protein [Bacteroidota bacterium]